MISAHSTGAAPVPRPQSPLHPAGPGRTVLPMLCCLAALGLGLFYADWLSLTGG